MILNFAACFCKPRYRVFLNLSRPFTASKTCSTLARTEDFACSRCFAFLSTLSHIPSSLCVIQQRRYSRRMATKRTGSILKIGKANEKSNARFVSHHYNFSAPSTLAKSICSDKEFVSLGINQENVKSWMLENLHRINIYVKSNKATTELVEAVLHYAFRPRFEGNI